ncbi:HD domain-containing phosphohydrolase [Lacibacterium aquatile]|uniref:HD domain-containing phosphohydrolase n=1 Tax=Lacibacterium aquatile TaxID=1168082 RepID=A0ABW5DQZ4_9PROT
MAQRILFVDDEPALLAGIGRHLRGQFEFDTANGGDEALALIEAKGPYAVLVTDMRMPNMDGLALLDRVKGKAPDTVRMMLTGNTDQGTAVNAINHGHIFSFLNKPCQPDHLKEALHRALRQHQLQTAERQLLEQTLTGAVGTMVDVLSTIHPLIFSRAMVVRELAMEAAEQLGICSWVMDLAAMLAPIGWVTVPTEVAARVVALGDRANRDDRALAEHVPEVGAKLLERIPRLEQVSKIVRYQAKQYDGGGWPHDDIGGGDRIPIESRLLKICNDLMDRAGHRALLASHLSDLYARKAHYDSDLMMVVDLVLRERMVAAAGEVDPQALIMVERPSQLQRGDRLEDGLLFLDGGLALAAGENVTEVNIARFTALNAIRPLGFPIRVYRQHPTHLAS